MFISKYKYNIVFKGIIRKKIRSKKYSIRSKKDRLSHENTMNEGMFDVYNKNAKFSMMYLKITGLLSVDCRNR